MNFQNAKKLPTPEEIVAEFPLSSEALAAVTVHQAEVRAILAGKDPRFLIIVGPCSAWPYEAVVQYGQRLHALSQEVGEHVKLVMRVFIQKPRTAKGWTGPINQPDPFAPPDITAGIRYCRKLMVELIETGLPIADECLFTHNSRGFEEIMSWVAIGARSSEDQEHRIFASATNCPVGLKNPTSGSIEIGVNSVVAAQHQHTFAFHGYQVETQGNPYAHLILRGGASEPNYQPADLLKAQALMTKHNIINPSVIVDASHDNSKVSGVKDYRQQIQVVRQVIETLKTSPELRPLVKGFMLESFIKGGNQKCEALTPQTIDQGGLSITDPCLSWEETSTLIREVAVAHHS